MSGVAEGGGPAPQAPEGPEAAASEPAAASEWEAAAETESQAEEPQTLEAAEAEEPQASEAAQEAPAADVMGAAHDAAEPPRGHFRPSARRRPGVIAIYFAYRASAALLIATPLAVLAGGAVRGYPRGDAVLFEPGGLMLIEVGRLAQDAAPALATQIGVGAVIAAALGLVPLAALIIALGRPGPLPAALVGSRVARALGPLALLWGVAALAQVAAAGLVMLVGSKLVASLALGRRADDLAELGVVAAALLAAFAVAVVHDLARASAVHEERGFYVAATRALTVARAAPLATAWACASRTALAAAAIVGAVFLVASVGLSSGGRVALAFAVHHAGLAVAAWLRASWLAAAIRLLERVAPKA